MKNFNTNLRLCGFAAIVATILISISARAVAQTNVQNVQVVSTPSGPPQTNLPNFSAVSTPSDTPAAAASPTASAASFGPIDTHDSLQTKFAPNHNVGDGVVITNPVKPAPSPAGSVSPAANLKNIPIQGSQVNQASHAAGTATGTIAPSKNISIQGSQVNEASHATGTGTISPSKNITIENSRANVNNPPTGNAGNSSDAANSGFNRHPGHKIKNKGQGQLSNAGAGGDSGPKLHDGQHKKRERIQTQGQGGNGQRHHHQRQVQSTQPQPALRAWGTTVHAGNADSAGDGGKKGKPKPTPAPH